MRPDIPFWTWVLARRIPIFALVTTLVCVIGGTMISRYTQSYVSIAQMLVNPDTQANRSIDATTHFEFLKFRALTSDEVTGVLSALHLDNIPLSRVNVRHEEPSGKIIIGYHDKNPETAHLVTTAITRGFQSAARTLVFRDAERRVAFHTSESEALRLELMQTGMPAPQDKITQGLYQTSLDTLAKAKADLQMPQVQIISVLSEPTLSKTPSGPNKSSMYMVLVSFAIFCGLIAILVLEWLDTVIRRPRDVEQTLGMATFGVIPDLQLQPIARTQKSEGGS